nr:hypothetical protein [Nitrospinaceae bacterium]NIR55179.1 hypothetical protein [Nitrospinaceae bacterium]NIS85603.1 hypothetical protein [Nitrospinaceae bacterium]NIT82449.1 hypothetical protein [Nitrospinaceae bacterium]NIU44662.1 hypothetical protein [Nitrospinaceae bacterium]
MKTPPPPVRNILVIRSATRILNATLESLKREFPEARISVLAQEPAQDSTARIPAVDEVISTGNSRRMGIFNLGSASLTALRQRRFDLAVALYNVDHGLGYANIDRLAWAVRPRFIRGYNPKGKYVSLTGASIWKKSLLEKTTLVWVALNGLATSVLFLMITLGLLAEWA